MRSDVFTNKTITLKKQKKKPGPNSKSISVPAKPKLKTYCVLQYWASLNTWLTSLANLSQELVISWKFIPYSK